MSDHSTAITPDDVAASLGRNDGGFGRNQQTYYEQPVVRAAPWGWEIVWYFYIGGIMAGSAMLSAFADETGRAEDAPLIRNGRYVALGGALASSVLLIKDLGRPERFLSMLRIFKLKSPMSVGVYTLIAFSNFAALAAANQLKRDGVLRIDLAGFLPRSFRNVMLALSSSLMGSYTGVLVSATAIPVWYVGRRHIPATFVCSAISTSCALNVLLLALFDGDAETIARLERLETICAIAEALLLVDFRRRSGDDGKPWFAGENGRKLRSYTLIGGIVVPLMLNAPSLLHRGRATKRHRVRTVLAAALTLFGGYTLRDTIVEAGRISAADPRAVLRR